MITSDRDILAKERFFDSLISIFRHYILHKPVVHVGSEEFLINLRHNISEICFVSV